MPLISIITPALNAAKTLAAAIDSVRGQSFEQWEMIIIDDASEDGTTALALRYAHNDDRIRIIRRAETGGIPQARNQGLSAARGRYIAFLDANDVWLPDKLKTQMEYMQDENAKISCTAWRWFIASGNRPGRLRRCPPRVTFDTLLQKPCVNLLTVMVDREQTGAFQFREDIGGCEDLALWLDLTKAGNDIYFLDKDLARCRTTFGIRVFRITCRFWWSWRIYRENAGLPARDTLKAIASSFLYRTRSLLF